MTEDQSWEEYRKMAESMYQKPPQKETPEGQKFNIGDIVKISHPQTWYSKESFNKDRERLYQIQYSYYQKYGGELTRDVKNYSLKHLFEDNSSSWYHEDELEIVKK